MPARAHTSLISSDPTDGARLEAVPERVVLTFTENLREPSEVGVSVDGKAVDAEVQVDGPRVVVTPSSEAPDGAYEVNYRVVSVDGHPIIGTTRFTVTDPDAVANEAPADEGTPTTVPSEEISADPADPAETSADAKDDSVWSSPLVLGALVVVVVLAIGGATVLRRRSTSSDDDRP
ncbi:MULTISPECIES: copper resistance CopC family protein [Aeromicrobium]|uniref:copper resistance CopC family protein n=1 Tax=Aeromicrobium TaxID=2040 RepID=UPI0019D51320|nr:MULTISPECIES: copper resistance CopC family protein [Aeromicrobium]